MGNHKFRHNAAQKLKALGHGKLYSVGCPRKYRPSGSARWKRDISIILRQAEVLKAGALVDGSSENKIVAKSIQFDRHYIRDFGGYGKVKRDHWVIDVCGQAVFADGALSCGCPYGCETPGVSVEKLRERILNAIKNPDPNWPDNFSEALKDAILSGKDVHDSIGQILPEYMIWEIINFDVRLISGSRVPGLGNCIP